MRVEGNIHQHHHQQDAYRSAVLRAKQKGLRHKLEDENGTLIDLINP
tara:strand:- start:399 stop:539 length:141 start_codon:yes stop_codon:yes gene_type:complete